MTLIPSRTYDALALRPAGDGLPLTQDLLDETPALVTGVLKLAQWVVIELLTARGSKPFSPTAGTDLLLAARSGGMRNEMTARTSFGMAAARVLARERATASPTTPQDERLASLTLASVVVVPGSVAFIVNVVTQAGTSRTIFAPVPTA